MKLTPHLMLILVLIVPSVCLGQVEEDEIQFDELIDLAQPRPDITNLFDFQGDADSAVMGDWSVAARWPIVALHAALLPDGDVLTYGTNEWGDPGSGFVYDRWRPSRGLANDSHLTLDVETSNNLFCSAQMLIPGTGGLMLVTGGSVEKNGRRNFGVKAVNVFDPINNTFFHPEDQMRKARWYPTLTMLEDGRVLAQGGRDENRRPTTLPEVFDPVAGTWKALTSADSDAAYKSGGWNYPRSFLSPNGDVLVMPTDQREIYYLDTSGRGSIREVRHLTVTPTPANLLAVQYDQRKILSIRGRDARRLTMTETDHVHSANISDSHTPVVGGRDLVGKW